MPQDEYSFAQTRIRLEEIVSQVRKKEVSLDKSLDLLEEGVRLANQCTELIDRADWDAAAGVVAEAGAPDGTPSGDTERGEASAAGVAAAGDVAAEDASDEVPEVPPTAAGDSQEGAEPQ